jgi:hypothetical protein
MRKFFLLFAIIPFFIFPLFAFSQEYTLLEPGVYNDQFKTINKGTSFPDYLNLVFKIGIGIAAGLAVIQIVIGGIQYMASESPFKIGDAKAKIEGAILGLVLALGIYIFLYTINPDLVSLKLNIVSPPPVTGVTGTATTIPETVLREGLSAATADEIATRKKLEEAGIKINKSACPSGTTSWKNVPGGCTNVAGLPDSAIQKLKALKTGCNCEVVITGGTEPGHMEHGKGKAIVDLSLSPDVTAYIKKTGKSTTYGGCSVGNKYSIDFTGGSVVGQKSVFTDEKLPGYYPHWHVCL